MKKILPLASFLLTINNVFAVCVPAKQVIDFPEDAPDVGMYHRVHPSGKYVLGSGIQNGRYGVGIIDLNTKDASGKVQAKLIKTPMIDETYPIEGSWSHLASPLHEDGMRYFKFDDILAKQAEAQPVMNDKDHNEWYHSAAELPGSTKTNYKFRTMLYGEDYRDYTIEYDKDGKASKTTKTATKKACNNLVSYLDSPILSKDGTEVAATTGSSTVIYKINSDSTCELVEDLGFYTSKVNFSYPKPNTKGQIVFTGNANIMVDGSPQYVRGAFIYDRDTKVTRRLSSDDESSVSYPGMTADGRVIYINLDNRQIVIVDPNQLNANGSESSDKAKCIHESGTGAGTTPVKTNSPVKAIQQ